MPEKRGRLYIHAQSAMRNTDRKEIIQLTLVARGRPHSPDPSRAFDWFDFAQEWTAKSFLVFTSEKMHSLGGKEITHERRIHASPDRPKGFTEYTMDRSDISFRLPGLDDGLRFGLSLDCLTCLWVGMERTGLPRALGHRFGLEVLSELEPYDELPTAHVGPTIGGGLGIEWHNGSRELDLEILPDGTIEYLKTGRSVSTGLRVGRMDHGEIPSGKFKEVRQLVRWLMVGV